MYLSQDGVKLYVLHLNSDTIYQFSMSVANDLSTASYDNKSFSVGSEESVPFGVFFNSDLTKMYVIGNSDSIYQYSLSTAGDVSTATYDNKSFSVTSQATIPQDLYISDDGTWMVVSDTGSQKFYQYTLSTAWDVSTASYDNKSLDPTGTNSISTDFIISPDKSTLVFVAPNETIYQFTMSTSGDLSTASYDNVSYDASGFGSSNSGLTISHDGSKMFYMINNSPEHIYEIDL